MVKQHMHNESHRQSTFILLGLAILGFALSSLSCSDEATQANAIVSPVALRNFVYKEAVIYADTAINIIKHIPMDGVVNLVGRSGPYTASTLIQFTPAYFPIRDTATVFSDTLRLRMVTWFGDSTASCSFNVYRILATWSQTTFTLDSMNSGFAEGPGKERGTLTIPPGPDTQFVSIPLDTAMVRQWLSSSTSADSAKFGIILVPTQGTGNIIRGFSQFSADSTSPRLKILAGSVTGSSRDTNSYTSGIGTFVTSLTNPVIDPAQLYVQAGVVRRAFLHFNVSSIPKGSIVSKAELLLNQTVASSILNRFSGAPSVIAHLLESSTDTSIYDRSQYTTGGLKSGDTMRIDARYIVQTWIKGTNYGVVIATTSMLDYLSGRGQEQSSLDLYAFANNKATLSRRPRLHIIYALGN